VNDLVKVQAEINWLLRNRVRQKRKESLRFS